MMSVMRHWYSNEWCKDDKARTQEQLQEIAIKIRRSCKLKECKPVSENFDTCTIYENEALGLRYWIKDNFGHIEEIDEARNFDC